MAKPIVYEIEIMNWDKYQRDTSLWFAVSTGLMDDPAIAELDSTEFRVFMLLLCTAGKKNSKSFRIFQGSVRSCIAISPKKLEKSICKLAELLLIEFTQTNKQTNNSSSPKSGQKFRPKDEIEMLKLCAPEIQQRWLAKWRKKDIEREAARALDWAIAKDSMRTKRGWQQFLNNWLNNSDLPEIGDTVVTG